MADSVDANAMPPGYDLYAGYVDGRYQSYEPAVAKFGHDKVVPIAVGSGTNHGHVGDVESGDMTPSSCVGWVVMRRQAGIDPTIYTSYANWPAVRQAFQDAGVPEPHYWIAAYPGNGEQLYAGSIAHQYADSGPNGENIDVSVVADFWPGFDSPAPSPGASTGGMKMLATDPESGGFWATDQNGDINTQNGAPFIPGLNTHPNWHAGEGESGGGNSVVGLTAFKDKNGEWGVVWATAPPGWTDQSQLAFYRMARDGTPD